jgi:hypothetical protein
VPLNLVVSQIKFTAGKDQGNCPQHPKTSQRHPQGVGSIPRESAESDGGLGALTAGDGIVASLEETAIEAVPINGNGDEASEEKKHGEKLNTA